MAKKLNIKAVGNFIKGGREWFLLLLSLLLAFFIWLLHNLSQDYSTFLNYEISVLTNIEGKSPQSKSGDVVILRGRANGFYILHNQINEGSSLEVNVDASLFHKSVNNPDEYYLNVADIKDQIIRKLGNSVNVEYITTTVLKFHFNNVLSVKLPVVLNTNLHYRSQYISPEEPVVKPDSVVVYGEEAVLMNLKNIYTDMLSLDDIYRNEQGMIKLICPKGVKLMEQNVFYSIGVERYIEKSLMVPIQVTNAPSDRRLTVIPSYVMLTYRQNYYTQRDFDADDFECVIDYNDYLESISSRLIPRVESAPEGVYSFKFDPEYIECTLIDK